MGPLTGIKIVEIKGIGPGPYAGMIFADLGAEVIVVEKSSKPGVLAPPSALDVNSRGKKSIALNLKSKEGLKVLFKLLETADAIFEGFRPGVAEKLGFGPDACFKVNPKLVYGRMTGWGQHGELSQSAGHDINYISLTGAVAAIGSQEKPIPPLNLVGDFAGGSLFLVIGILSALLETKSSGKGQVIDAAITDGSAHLMSVYYTLDKLNMWSIKRAHNALDGGCPFYQCYETSDGKFMSVGALEPHFFKILIDLLKLPQDFITMQMDRNRWSMMQEAFTEVFLTKTQSEWIDLFEGTDACVAGVLDYKQAASHPHNQSRKTYIEVNGETQPAPAPRFSRTQPAAPKPPTSEGSDVDVILKDIGFSNDDIAKLRDSEALT